MKNGTRRSVAISLVAMIWLVGCGGDAADCQTDDDCPEGHACVDEICQDDGGDLNVNEEPNDPECPDDGCKPRLFTPDTVEFFDASAGSEYRETTFIENHGEEPLELHDIRLEGDDHFELTFPGRHPADSDPPADEDDDSFSNVTLAPDETFLIRVWFHPDDPTPRDGTITIDSNAADADEHTVDLEGNHHDVCLQTDPRDSLDFGAAPIGETTYRTIQLRNCSMALELQLEGIVVADDDRGAFEIRDDSYPGDLPGQAMVLGPKEDATVVVGYSPDNQEAHDAQLLVSSDAEGDHAISLSGQGTTASCPVPVIDVDNTDIDTDGDTIEVAPHQPVELSGLDSHDPDGGTIENFEWSVIDTPFASHPEAATTTMEPSATDPEPTFRPDVAGDFRIELGVVDDEGIDSCQRATLNIQAVPQSDIYLQAAWHNLYTDDTELFEGTDVNLHYVHPDGDWHSDQWSVYFDQPQHNWDSGEVTVVSDDNWGEYPEIITHDDPVDGHGYDVGVHYNDDFGLGPSDVTMSIYLEGQLEYEVLDHRIYDVGDLWHVGSVEWGSTPAFAEVDEVTTDHPIPVEPPDGP